MKHIPTRCIFFGICGGGRWHRVLGLSRRKRKFEIHRDIAIESLKENYGSLQLYIYMYSLCILQVCSVQLCGCFQNLASIWAGDFNRFLYMSLSFDVFACKVFIVEKWLGTQQVLRHQICSLLMTSLRTNVEVILFM